MKPTSPSFPLFLFPLSASLPPLSILSFHPLSSRFSLIHPSFSSPFSSPVPPTLPLLPFSPSPSPAPPPLPSLPRRRLIVPHRCVPRFLSIRAYIKRIVYDKSSSLEFNKTSIRPLRRASRCIYDARVWVAYSRVIPRMCERMYRSPVARDHPTHVDDMHVVVQKNALTRLHCANGHSNCSLRGGEGREREKELRGRAVRILRCRIDRFASARRIGNVITHSKRSIIFW